MKKERVQTCLKEGERKLKEDRIVTSEKNESLRVSSGFPTTSPLEAFSSN